MRIRARAAAGRRRRSCGFVVGCAWDEALAANADVGDRRSREFKAFGPNPSTSLLSGGYTRKVRYFTRCRGQVDGGVALGLQMAGLDWGCSRLGRTEQLAPPFGRPRGASGGVYVRHKCKRSGPAWRTGKAHQADVKPSLTLERAFSETIYIRYIFGGRFIIRNEFVIWFLLHHTKQCIVHIDSAIVGASRTQVHST